jgi:bifunctional DNase/RNase
VQEFDVVGVRVEMPSQQPVVLLRERHGMRYLPIWIGATEASAIAFAQQGVVPPRPLTHDLFRDVLAALDRPVRQVQITDLREGVFFAELVFDDDVVVSARPSDAIALALRTGAPIVGAETVLAEAGIEIPDEELTETDESGEAGELAGDADQQVERFRAFLDQVSPEDFSAGEGGEPSPGGSAPSDPDV